MQYSAQPNSGIISLAAGAFAATVSAIWNGPKIAEYLTATDRRRQIWHACLASPACAFQPDNSNNDRLYQKLTYWRAGDLIIQAYACRPRGIVHALGRLGPTARTPFIYPLLIEVLNRDNAAAKAILHATELPDELIETMAALPSGATSRTIETLVGTLSNDPPESLALFIWTLGRLQKVWPGTDVDRLLAADRPLKLLQSLLCQRAFPAAPWDGDARLSPITCGTELISAGLRFRNCLGHRRHGGSEILKVLNGAKYFYQWKGHEPALIELQRFADVGWYVGTAVGKDNSTLTRESRLAIAQSFSSAADICPSRLLIRSGIYPCSEFWSDIVGGY
jgi:hypothetical protein